MNKLLDLSIVRFSSFVHFCVSFFVLIPRKKLRIRCTAWKIQHNGPLPSISSYHTFSILFSSVQFGSIWVSCLPDLTMCPFYRFRFFFLLFWFWCFNLFGTHHRFIYYHRKLIIILMNLYHWTEYFFSTPPGHSLKSSSFSLLLFHFFQLFFPLHLIHFYLVVSALFMSYSLRRWVV